jgi:hypothetical protein
MKSLKTNLKVLILLHNRDLNQANHKLAQSQNHKLVNKKALRVIDLRLKMNQSMMITCKQLRKKNIMLQVSWKTRNQADQSKIVDNQCNPIDLYNSKKRIMKRRLSLTNPIIMLHKNLLDRVFNL